MKDERFVSTYGWALELPPGWRLIDPAEPGPAVLSVAAPSVFSDSADPGTAITWMLLAGPVNPGVASRFETATMLTGTADLQEAREIARETFPLIGRLDAATVVELPDGSRGLELVETFSQSGSPHRRRGYQLLVPVYSGPGSPGTFQRLCYYADEDSFERRLDEVRRVARSFHYLRPFGPGPVDAP